MQSVRKSRPLTCRYANAKWKLMWICGKPMIHACLLLLLHRLVLISKNIYTH